MPKRTRVWLIAAGVLLVLLVPALLWLSLTYEPSFYKSRTLPAAQRLGVTLVRTGPPKPKGPGFFTRMWQGLGEAWEEMLETVKDYKLSF